MGSFPFHKQNAYVFRKAICSIVHAIIILEHGNLLTINMMYNEMQMRNVPCWISSDGERVDMITNTRQSSKQKHIHMAVAHREIYLAPIMIGENMSL